MGAIRQITSWFIGEYGDKLMSVSDCADANEELNKDKKNSDDDEESTGYKVNNIENMTLDIGPFEVKTTDEIVSMLKYLLKHDKSSETTKGFGLTALMKIRHKYQLQAIDKDDKIDAILNSFNNDKQIEVQQRSIEILSLFESTDKASRAKILKPMPVPKIERLFDESKSNALSPSLSDDEDDSDESDESTEDESDKSDDEKSDVSDSDKSDQSDSVESDTSSEKRRKRRSSRKKEKDEKRDKKRKDKKKDKAPVIPMLLGPDETESLPNTNGIKIDNVQSPMPSRNGNDNVSINMNGNGNNQSSSNQMDDLLNFGSTSPPKQQQQPKSNNSIDDLLGMG